MKINISLFIATLFSCFGLFAQTSSDYDRSTLGYVALNHADNKYSNWLEQSIKKIKTTDKFFQNNISTNYIRAVGTASEIENSLRQNRIPAQVLSDWRNVEVLIERGRYNLNDQEVQQLRATARGFESGTKNEEWFGKLVKNTFIITLDFSEIKTMVEVYNDQEQRNRAASGISGSSPSPVVRDQNGYEAKVDVYIYKVRMDAADYAKLTKSNWKDFDSHIRHDYNIDFIKKVNVKCEATQSNQGYQKSEQSLFDLLMQDAVEKASEKLPTGYKGFEVKEAIISNYPVKAKLGMKEDLRVDKMFFVYEFKESRSGERKSKKKGVVRVRKVVDNRYVATGTSDASTFYKVGLGKYKKGMFLSEKVDRGISIGVGKVIKPFDGYFAKVSYNLSPIINRNNLTQLKVFAEGGLSFSIRDENKLFEDYEIQNGIKFSKANELIQTFYGIGIEKDLYVLPFLQISPQAGFFQEEIEYKNKNLIQEMSNPLVSPVSDKTLYFRYGLGVSLNITHNVKFAFQFTSSSRSFNKSSGLGSIDKFALNYPNNFVIRTGNQIQIAIKVDI